MATNKNPFEELFGAFNQGNNPFAQNIDWDGLVNTGRQNAEAFSKAAQATFQGTQAVFNLQAKNAQKSAEDISNFVKSAGASSNDPEAAVAKNAEFAKSSLEGAAAHLKEVSDLAAKASNEASEIINKRTSEALSEIAKQSANSNKASKKSSAA